MRKIVLALVVAVGVLAPVNGTVVFAQPGKRVPVSPFGDWDRLTYSAGRSPYEHTVNQTRILQHLLRHHKFNPGAVDGHFGKSTVSAVRAFQKSRGLQVDGVVGGQTWQKLTVTIKRGDKGDAVRAVQTALRQLVGHEGQRPNSNLPIDGVFGFRTEQAVRSFQEEFNIYNAETNKPILKVDGVVGAKTWRAF